MDKLQNFIRTSLIGGLIVVLPVAILLFTFTWLFQVTTNIIQPLTDLFMKKSFSQAEIIADILVIILIILTCFVIGVLIKTAFGRFLHETLEQNFLRPLPGYSLVKETVVQFIGNNQSPFSSVALVQIFENQTMMTAFVTDKHQDGSYTVFVPTGPNPTSGNIYHLQGQYVHHIDVTVEDAMRSIISCGAGSGKLINMYLDKRGVA